ncbi:MAG: GtrA family protein [Parvularculaceae bacterium]|nr:GtrA family protein [Parvularculaceae bacterium]
MTLFQSVKRETAARFARFVAVGLINTAFGYAVYALLVLAGLGAQAALICSFSIGVLWNYFTTARFVFEVSGYDRLPAYAGCYIVIYLLNAAALRAALIAGVHPLAAQAILLPAAAILSFVLLSRVLRPQS